MTKNTKTVGMRNRQYCSDGCPGHKKMGETCRVLLDAEPTTAKAGFKKGLKAFAKPGWLGKRR